jgi:hypothetical protein
VRLKEGEGRRAREFTFSLFVGLKMERAKGGDLERLLS